MAMIDYTFWLAWGLVFFYGTPFAMLMISIVLTIFMRHFCLTAMLESLKNSLLFSSRHARGADYQSSFYGNLLVIEIGDALIFSRSNIRSGVLDAEDLVRLPRRFRIMAVINSVCFHGWLLAILIIFPAMKWERFVRAGQVFDISAALQVALYIVSVMALSVTYALTVYAVHYRLHTMLNAIKPGPLSRLSQAMAIGSNEPGWRSMLFIKLSRAVLFKNSKKGDASHDVFDLEALPVSFKRLAVASLLCMYVGMAGVVIAVVVYALSDTAV